MTGIGDKVLYDRARAPDRTRRQKQAKTLPLTGVSTWIQSHV
jgi:hypothetical protein